MKITLAKANKIIKKLEENKVIPLSVSVRTSEDVDIDRVADIASKGFITELEKQNKKVNLRFDLRRKVATENAKCGILDILADIALARGLMSVLNLQLTRQPSVLGVISKEEFKDLLSLSRKIEEKDPTKVQPIKTVLVRYNEGLAENVKAQVQAQTLNIEKMLEKRNELNFNNFIELTKEEVEFLKGEGLIF